MEPFNDLLESTLLFKNCIYIVFRFRCIEFLAVKDQR